VHLGCDLFELGLGSVSGRRHRNEFSHNFIFLYFRKLYLAERANLHRLGGDALDLQFVVRSLKLGKGYSIGG